METNEKKWCVYKHTSPSGKVYIGITSQEPIRRWNTDGSGYKNNVYFWRAIQKYGWDNFQHEILFANVTKEFACKKEQELILHYNSTNPSKGYNLSAGGEGTEGISKFGELNPFYGKHHTEETKNKLREQAVGRKDSDDTKRKKSEATRGSNNPMYGKSQSEETKIKISQALQGNTPWMKGKHHTNETKQKLSQYHKKTVLQFDKQVNYINCYPSVKEAAEATGINKYNIAGCCRGTHPTAGGFIWVYKQDYEKNPQMILPQKKQRKNTKGKAVNQYSLNGVFIMSYISISLASRESNISASCIAACCNGTQKTAGGFLWRYKEDEQNSEDQRIN